MRRRPGAVLAGAVLTVALLASGCSGGPDPDPDPEADAPAAPPTRTVDVFAIPEPELPDDYGEDTPAAVEAYVRYFFEEAYPYARRSGFPELVTSEFETERCRRCDRFLDEVEARFTDDTLVVMTDPVVDRVDLLTREQQGGGLTTYLFDVGWSVEHEEVVAADGTLVEERDDLEYDDLILVAAVPQRYYIVDWVGADEVTDGEA